MCAAIDACDSNPCQHGATCSSVVDGYVCVCEQGYTGDNCETGECTAVVLLRRDILSQRVETNTCEGV